MRSARLLAVAILAVVLALSSAQNAFAKIELAYDDGTPVGGGMTPFAGVWFSLPSGVFAARLLYVRFDWTADPLSLVVHITGSNHVTELTAPITLTLPSFGTGCPAGWLVCGGFDVSGLGIAVTGDFYVVLERVTGDPTHDAVNSGHSFQGASLAALTTVSGGDWSIRVDIDPISPVVGGLVMPVNTLAVLGPWFAVIGLVGCVTAVAVVAKKRRP
jgi:hypothetical protein